MSRWPGGDGFDVVFRWPTRPQPTREVVLPEWLFRPPAVPVDGEGLRDRAERDEWWQRCRAWCEANDYPAMDLIRVRMWRRGAQVSRFPDDPPGMFPPELFGIDRDRDC